MVVSMFSFWFLSLGVFSLPKGSCFSLWFVGFLSYDSFPLGDIWYVGGIPGIIPLLWAIFA